MVGRIAVFLCIALVAMPAGALAQDEPEAEPPVEEVLDLQFLFELIETDPEAALALLAELYADEEDQAAAFAAMLLIYAAMEYAEDYAEDDVEEPVEP